MDVSSKLVYLCSMIFTFKLIDLEQTNLYLYLYLYRPYATGKSLWRRDEIKGDYHMDGAFSVLSHPKCRASVDLPLRADLLLNGLSPDLERSKARHFYNLGLNEIM